VLSESAILSLLAVCFRCSLGLRRAVPVEIPGATKHEGVLLE
jgi:hypothetical protein